MVLPSLLDNNKIMRHGTGKVPQYFKNPHPISININKEVRKVIGISQTMARRGQLCRAGILELCKGMSHVRDNFS